MSSETHEMQHSAHDHPTAATYWKVGFVLIGLTVLEVAAYYLEEAHVFSPGIAALVIAVLSLAKFLIVVMWYMHLKYDSKIFTGVFVFPALLGTLVIGGLYVLQQILPRAESIINP